MAERSTFRNCARNRPDPGTCLPTGCTKAVSGAGERIPPWSWVGYFLSMDFAFGRCLRWAGKYIRSQGSNERTPQPSSWPSAEEHHRCEVDHARCWPKSMTRYGPRLISHAWATIFCACLLAGLTWLTCEVFPKHPSQFYVRTSFSSHTHAIAFAPLFDWLEAN